MKLLLQRLSHDEQSTLGELRIDGLLVAATVEDEPRAVKLRGETRIPAGSYRIKLRTVGGFHARELRRYGDDWHHGMLWLQDVPGFEYILIHCGNTERDTEGCIIVGTSAVPNGKGGGSVSGSRAAYERLYPRVAAAILAGEMVTIEVRNEVAA